MRAAENEEESVEIEDNEEVEIDVLDSLTQSEDAADTF